MARGFTAIRLGFAIGVAVCCGVALGCSQDAAYGARAGDPADSLDSVADCAVAHEGCACAGNQPPIACRPDALAVDTGVCFEGTRYCRNGTFGACEDVQGFAAKRATSQSALIDAVATHPACSDCDANCYRVRDELNPSSGTLAGAATGVTYHPVGAGLTLAPRDGAILDPPAPSGVPAGTLYLAIRDGLRGSVNYTKALHPVQSDVYVLLDQSLTMDEETSALRDRFGSGSLLDAPIDCVGGDASLQAGGIAGALRCMIDSPRVGIGMFRDIPVPPYASDTSQSASQQETEASSEIAYRHLVDQSTDLNRTRNALLALEPVEASGTPDIAGSHIPALHAMATGKGQFMGLGRVSVADAPACSSGRFGYPCFLQDKDPMVVVVTDAPMHNGPDPKRHPYNYDPAKLKRRRGTMPGQTHVPATNDRWQSPFLLTDDAGNSVGTFYGSTSGFNADVSGTLAGCGASSSGRDAMFRFDVLPDDPPTATSEVHISTFGSWFDTVVSVFDHPPIEIEAEPVNPINELFESAHELGDVSERHVVATSDTAGGGNYDMSVDYQSSLFGASCGANTMSRDAVFAFDVNGTSAPVQLEVKLDMGAAYGVLSIYEEGAGPLPRWPARTTTLVASGNSDASAANVYEIPSGADDDYLSIAGDTTGLGADYDANELGAPACDPDPAAMDVAFKIHVDGMRRLRFDTEGTSFDTMLSLHSAPPDGTAASFIACDDDGVTDTGSSFIEQTLTDGDYYIVLKGMDAAEQGEYLLTVRDLDAVQTVELACDASTGSGDPAVVTFTAMPGARYYALVKGDRPEDEGEFTLSVHDLGGDAPHRLACDAPSLFGWGAELDLELAPGSYYIVVKGERSSDAGDYRLEVGGASGTTERFLVPSYQQTVDALRAGGVRVASVVSCQGGGACDDLTAQSGLLAYQTDGVVRAAADATDVPAQVVKAVQLMQAYDTVSAELEFVDPNPGFANVTLTALSDPNNGCASTDGIEFRTCVPGATPTFALAMTNPALAPVEPSGQPFGAYRMTLRVSAERDGSVVSAVDVPVLVVPNGVAPPNTYATGSYHQDVDGRGCKEVNQHPSWDRLTLDADVRPDTSIGIYACSADTAAELAMCGAGGTATSGYKRVGRISAGSGTGTACTVPTQQVDCPNGYCSPYTHVCNEIEGADCMVDKNCPGTAAGRCRVSAASPTMTKTCVVRASAFDPASALDADNYREFMRVRFDLESLGDGSRTPSLFFWETQYWCRNVE